MNILGISAWYHDSAACIVIDGHIIAAAQEERFTRVKHDSSFPASAIRYCMRESGLAASDIDIVCYYEKPILKFDRLLETYLAFAPRGFLQFLDSIPLWVSEKLFIKRRIISELRNSIGVNSAWSQKIEFVEHHVSHAASAFFPSPFKRAAVLTIDGVGEWATATLAVGENNKLSFKKEIRFPHSIGLLYSAFTFHLGFKINSGEYKIMGLAPYGEPRFTGLIKDNLIDIKPDGSFKLDLSFFDFCTGRKMTNKKFSKLVGFDPRPPEGKLEQIHMDFAASIQEVTNELVTLIGRNISEETGEKKLCMAGGVALNCASNGKLALQGIFDEIWVQPAAGDAGGAIGAALASYHIAHGKKRVVKPQKDAMRGSKLGPSFSDREIEQELSESGLKFTKLNRSDLVKQTAEAIAAGKAVGWFQGKMEFGPRALGSRSIIADPRSPTMQRALNEKIKFRESFRPFAPSVLADKAPAWFNLSGDSPYMLFISGLKADKILDVDPDVDAVQGLAKLAIVRSEVPAVTHVDYSARVQTVSQNDDPLFYELIEKFNDLTGVPMVINTSFNVRGEPIVCKPADAVRCFLNTHLDLLVIGAFVIRKLDQSQEALSPVDFMFQLD